MECQRETEVPRARIVERLTFDHNSVVPLRGVSQASVKQTRGQTWLVFRRDLPFDYFIEFKY